MIKKLLKSSIIFLSLFATACSGVATDSTTSNDSEYQYIDIDSEGKRYRRLKEEESNSLALDLLEFKLEDMGYSAALGAVTNGEETFYGVIYSDFSSAIKTDNNEYYAEAGFFQIVSDYEKTPSLFTPDKLKEEKLFVGKIDDEEQQFIITLSLPSLDSFSFVCDNWYNLCKRVGEYIFEVNTYENDRQYYDMDISCYSYDEDRWLFKSDNDILAFNFEVSGLYSDYSNAYITAVNMMQELLEQQDSFSTVAESYTYVVISGELLTELQFSGQEPLINGVPIKDIAKAQEQIGPHDAISITSEGIKVIQDEEYYAKQRVQRGILGVISNALLIGGQVLVCVVTWGAAIPVVAVTLATSIYATTCATFNIIEAAQDIKYGKEGDVETRATNYMKESFQKAFGDDAGEVTFNVLTIASTIVSAMTGPIVSLVAQGISLGIKAGYIALSVARFIAVKAIETAVVMVSSIAIGEVASLVTSSLTGDEIAAGYVKYVTTLAAGIALGIGAGFLDKKYDLSGYQMRSYLKDKKKYFTQEQIDKDLHEIDKAYDRSRVNGRKEVIRAIKEGRDLEEYGIYRGDPVHDAFVEDVKQQLAANGGNINKVQAYNRGDPRHWEFAHAIDRNQIKEAYLTGKIDLKTAVSCMENTRNGALVPYQTHLELHGGKFTNPTDFQKIIQLRPSAKEDILSIIAAGASA